MKLTIEQLPHSVQCDDCDTLHFLSLNRTVDGTWCIGYVAFALDGERIIPGLALNDCVDLKEAAVRMYYALERYNKRRAPRDKAN